MHEADKCWERGRLVCIPLNAYHSHSEDNQRFFALRAPSNQLNDLLGKADLRSIDGAECYSALSGLIVSAA
jgi:hypothetical protein